MHVRFLISVSCLYPYACLHVWVQALIHIDSRGPVRTRCVFPCLCGRVSHCSRLRPCVEPTAVYSLTTWPQERHMWKNSQPMAAALRQLLVLPPERYSVMASSALKHQQRVTQQHVESASSTAVVSHSQPFFSNSLWWGAIFEAPDAFACLPSPGLCGNCWRDQNTQWSWYRNVPQPPRSFR